jgi:hypothetical protein
MASGIICSLAYPLRHELYPPTGDDMRFTSTILLIVMSSTAWAEPPQHSGNAAVQYWQAFAHLPVMNEAQGKLIEEWFTTPLEGEAVKLLHSAEASLLYLQRASKCLECRWDLHYDDGPTLLMPHLAKCRTLAQLAGLQVRHDASQGKKGEAAERLCQMFKLSRHAGSEPVLISILVGYKIEDFAFDTAAHLLPEFGGNERKLLQIRVNELGKFATVKETIATEKIYMNGWMARTMEQREQRKPGSWRSAWANLLDPKDPTAKKLNDIKSYEEARKLIADMEPVYDQLMQVFDLPFAEQTKKLETILNSERGKNPVGALLLPALHRCQQAEHRQKAREQLFQAAIRVVSNGKEMLSNISDPYGTGTFDYQATPGGFELSSKLIFQEKPVKLVVGK